MLFSVTGTETSAAETAATGPAFARRALVVGVGSTGYETIVKLRRFLLERYGTLRDLPVRFLCLETHGGKRQEAVTAYDHPELALQDDEWLHLAVTGAANTDLESRPGLRTWVPREAIAADIRDGAGNSRLRGRLAFFWNYSQVAERLSRQWQEIVRYKREDGTSGDVVYTIGTLAGGTCSGCFVDMGYTLRHLLRSSAPEQIAYLSLVGSNANQVLQANCYAALKELNHFNSTATPYEALHLDRTTVSFPGNDYPFDLPYLISSEAGPANYALTEEQIAEMVALDIFNDVGSPQFSNKRTGGRDNIKEQALREADLLGCPKRYLTFGLAMIAYPAYKYRRACAARLGRDLLSEWLRTEANVSLNGLLEQTRRQMALRGLLTEQGKSSMQGSRLQMQVTSSQKLSTWADDWVTAQADKFDELCRGGNQVRLSGWLRGNHDRELAPRYLDMDQPRTVTDEEACALLERPAPGVLSEVKKHLHQVAQDQLKAAQALLRQVVSDAISEPGYRVANTLRAFGMMRDELLREVAASREAAANYFRDARLREQAWQRALTAVQSTADSAAVTLVTVWHPASSVKHAATRALKLCRDWHVRQTQAVLEEYMGFVYLALVQYVGQLEQQVKDYEALLQAAAQELLQQEKTYSELPPLLTGETVEPQQDSADTVGATAARGNTDEARRTVEREVLRLLSGRPEAQLFELAVCQPGELAAALMRQALPHFDYLHTEVDVCAEWLKRHPSAADRLAAFRKVYADANIHMALVEQDQDFIRTGREEQALVAYHCLSRAAGDEMARLTDGLALPADQKDHLGDVGQDPFRLLMLREYGGFPLRLWAGLRPLQQAFQVRLAAERDLVRRDIEEWVPLEDVPSSAEQADLWRTLVAGWALGALQVKATEGRPVFTYVRRSMEGETTLQTAPWGQSPPPDQGRRPDAGRLNPQAGQSLLPPLEMLPVVYSLYEQGPDKLKSAVQAALRAFTSQHGEYAGVALYALFSDFRRTQANREFADFLARPLEEFLATVEVLKPANARTSRVQWPASPLRLELRGGAQRLPLQAYDQHDALLGPVYVQAAVVSGAEALQVDPTGLLVPVRAGQARLEVEVRDTLQGTLQQTLDVEVS